MADSGRPLNRVFSLFVALAALACGGGVAHAQCTDWVPLVTGQGANGVNGRVNAVCSYDDGSGPGIYVGGDFAQAGNADRSRIARWNGVSFAPLTSGLNGEVKALEVFDDGTGPALYVGGRFSTAGGLPIPLLARWNGSQWSTVGAGVSGLEVNALKVYGNALYVGGNFSVNGVPASNLAVWTASGWRALGFGNTVQVTARVSALEVHEDDGGRALYIGGNMSIFVSQQGTVARSIARYDGFSISSVGSLDSAGEVLALASHVEAGQRVLYAGGSFQRLGGVDLANIGRWNGTSWTSVGGGVPSGQVLALAGASGALYVGGTFASVSSQFIPETRALAIWDSVGGWRPIRAGINSLFGGSDVRSLSTHSDGLSDALYVGGSFTRCAGVDAQNVLRSVTGRSPIIQSSPVSRTVLLGEKVQLSVSATGSGPLRYSWRRDGVNLFDSGRLMGVHAATMTIAGAQPEDFGAYDVVVANDCGSIVTRASAIAVLPSCMADFNGDGVLNSQDFFEFLTAFFAGC